mmetsp:Transcript_52268/g.160953  ORF Transcript_52268/g.160953 Transcript_52268/m.160953 type:complete len:254 (+) Transcript_52268:544-1305(+)
MPSSPGSPTSGRTTPARSGSSSSGWRASARRCRAISRRCPRCSSWRTASCRCSRCRARTCCCHGRRCTSGCSMTARKTWRRPALLIPTARSPRGGESPRRVPVGRPSTWQRPRAPNTPWCTTAGTTIARIRSGIESRPSHTALSRFDLLQRDEESRRSPMATRFYVSRSTGTIRKASRFQQRCRASAAQAAADDPAVSRGTDAASPGPTSALPPTRSPIEADKHARPGAVDNDARGEPLLRVQRDVGCAKERQ